MRAYYGIGGITPIDGIVDTFRQGGIPFDEWKGHTFTGVEEKEDGEWCEYYDEEGRDYREWEEEQQEEMVVT